MNRWMLLGIFGVVAVAQCAVPASMILKRETTLAQGTLYKFNTEPVDPYDPFRGRYVAIAIRESTAPNPKNLVLERNEKVFVTVIEGEDGYAKLGEVLKSPPKEGDYIKTHVNYTNADGARVDIPFNRYYMDEHLAPNAERAYRNTRTDEEKEAYVTVRILNGFGVIEELYINDKPIVDYVLEEMENDE